LPSPDEHSTPRTSAVEHRFQTLADALAVGILTADVDGAVVYVNPAGRELLWRSAEDILGAGWLTTVHPDDRDAVASTVASVLDSGTPDRADFRIDVAGYTRWVRARFNPIDAAAGGGWVGIFDDVTADRATSEELLRRAAHDPLTGLPNRTLLQDRLDQAIARSRRAQTPLAVFFLDLNAFKPVNDRLGHKAGDAVLREVGDRIRSTMRTEDTAARLGGDEFVVVTERTERDVAEQVAQRLEEVIARPFEVAGEVVRMRTSIGVAWTPTPRVGAAALVDLADQAMYRAKRAGETIAFAPET